MQPPPNQNPFAPSQVNPFQAIKGPNQPNRAYPIFAMIMFIASLVFCFLRLGIVLLSLIGLFSILNNGGNGQIDMNAAYLEVGSGAAMVVFGFLGNILMLMKKPVGYYFGWLLVLAVLANIGGGLMQAAAMFGQFDPGSAEFVGAIIGAGVVLCIRVGILIAYVIAMFQFKRWADHQPTNPLAY